MIQTKKILVVDDTKEKRELFKDFLTMRGFDVSVAENGKGGYSASQESPFDLIIMDLNLPDIQGVEVCRMIRTSAKTSGVPIIIATASTPSAREKVWGFRSGADDYVTTPFSLEELLERIYSIFRRMEAAQSETKNSAIAENAAQFSTQDNAPNLSALTDLSPNVPAPAENSSSPPASPFALPQSMIAQPTESAPIKMDKPEETFALILAWEKLFGILAFPFRTLNNIHEDQDFAPAVFLLALAAVLDSVISTLQDNGMGGWMASLLLNVAGSALPWLAISGLAFMSLPFLGSDSSWRRVSTVAALANAPRILGASLSLFYITTASFRLPVESHAFTTGMDILARAPYVGAWKVASRIGIVDAWVAVLTAVGLVIACRIPGNVRILFFILLGLISLTFGVLTPY